MDFDYIKVKLITSRGPISCEIIPTIERTGIHVKYNTDMETLSIVKEELNQRVCEYMEKHFEPITFQ